MSKWQFELTNWNGGNAHTLALNSITAQAAAMDITLDTNAQTAIEQLCVCIDNMITALGATGRPIAVNGNVLIDDATGRFNLNLGLAG